jgi:hypothetical protein
MGMESWPKDTTAAKNVFYGDFPMPGDVCMS